MSDKNELMSDEEYDQLLSAGTAQQSLQRAMDMQKLQAEQMRGATPEGQMVSGRYVAPNIMQYVGEMAKNFSSAKLQQDALATGGKMAEAQGGQNALILQALKRNRAMSAPTPAPAFSLNGTVENS